jgi:iron complex outermembrane receptor protein
MKIYSKLMALTGAMTVLATFGSVTQAQEVTESSILEEIIVTAERRDQSLQDVPLSITAFGSEKRDIVGILSIQDMANFAPGVSYATSTDRPSIRGIARESNFFTIDSPVANYVDGVFTSTVQDAQRRPIFIERTEILRGPQGALSGRGSIAGAINTISKRPEDEFGAEVRTYAADYSRYGVEATVTGPLTDWLKGRLNLGTSHQDDGYFDNVSTSDTEGDQPNNRDSVDIHLEADLGEDVELFFKAAWVDYLETRRSGVSTAPFVAGVQGAPSAYGASTSALVPLASWGYFDPTAVRLGNVTENPASDAGGGNLREFSNDFRATQELMDDYDNYTLHLTWHAPMFDVKWISGFQDYTYYQIQDIDGTDVQQMTLPPTVFTPAGRVVSPGGTNEYSEDRHWSSNEITLTSVNDGPLQWIVGVFRSEEETLQKPLTATYDGYAELAAPVATLDGFFQIVGFPPCPNGVSPFPGVPCYNPDNVRAVPVNPNGSAAIFGQIDNVTTSNAIFGQIDFEVNEQWSFSVGARYNKDEKEATEASRIVANNLGSGLGPSLAGGGAFFGLPIALDVTPFLDPDDPLNPTDTFSTIPEGVVTDYGIDPVTGNRVRDLADEWDATTGSVGVNYTPDSDTLLFFRAAVGSRSGGFNAGFINGSPLFDEETLYSYEVGYKGTLAQQLQLQVSAFYYDFRDNQQPLPTLGNCTNPNDLSSCTQVNSFVNLPKSESLGLEVELTWAATNDLNLFFTYGYLDAKVKDGIAAGTNGFSNSDDPAAILPGANQFAAIPGQFDDVTGLQRYTQDISGNTLRNSPKHRFALNANYLWEFSSGSFILSGSYVWRDEQYSDLFENPLAEVPGYSTVGLRGIWNDASDRYTVIVYGSNLTDEEAADGAGLDRQRTGLAGAAGAAYYQSYNLAPPREYGVEFQYRFGG